MRIWIWWEKYVMNNPQFQRWLEKVWRFSVSYWSKIMRNFTTTGIWQLTWGSLLFCPNMHLFCVNTLTHLNLLNAFSWRLVKAAENLRIRKKLERESVCTSYICQSDEWWNDSWKPYWDLFESECRRMFYRGQEESATVLFRSFSSRCWRFLAQLKISLWASGLLYFIEEFFFSTAFLCFFAVKLAFQTCYSSRFKEFSVNFENYITYRRE